MRDDSGSACGAMAGTSTDDGSPISIGMVTTSVSGIVAVSFGSASVRSLGRPATFGARGRVRKVAQTVQFVGAFEGGVDEILPHFGLGIAIGQNPPAGGHGARQRQHQNQNGEKYAAYWKNAENRQHCL